MHQEMERFLKSILFGSVSFLVLALAVEFYQAKVVNVYTYKSKYMENNSHDIKTLLLGNSLMENSINPHLLGDSVFDLAISGRWIYYDYKLLERYISEMGNLRHVVFGMGYAFPFQGSYHFPEADKSWSNRYKYYYEKHMNIRYDRPPYYYWFGILNGHVNITSLRDGYEFLDIDPNGYIGYQPIIGQAGMEWKILHNIDPNVIHNPHADEQIGEYKGYLKEMARLCKQHKVRFIVFTPPCHDSYIENVRQEGIDILHGMIDEIRVEYPIDYVDYLQDEDFRADSLFFDCSHLNSIGADMFALRVKKDFGL